MDHLDDDDHSSNALADRFRQIPDSESQREALRGLIEALTHHQIRHLRFLIDKVDLHCDLIAKLPVEIKCLILQYLPLYQCYQARRVSRAWYDILTSPSIQEAVLRSWSLSSATSFSTPDEKAECIDALHNGKASSLSIHYLDCYQDPLGAFSKAAYSAGRFAWIDKKDERMLYSLDIRTGLRTCFTIEDRCTLSNVAISPAMIAATGLGGRCHIWTLPQLESRSFNMPSARVHKLLLAGDSVAIVLALKDLQHAPEYSIITWNSRNRKTHSFLLPLPRLDQKRYYRLTAMLDSDGASLVYFHYISDGRFPSMTSRCYYSTRISLEGQILAQDCLYTREPAGPDHWIEGVQTSQIATIWSSHQALPVELGVLGCEITRIYYNFDNNRLRLDTVVVDTPVHNLGNIRFFLGDLAFTPSDPSEDGYSWLRVLDFSRSTNSIAQMARTASWQEVFRLYTDDMNMSEVNRTFIFLGDDVFQIHGFHQGIAIWCFDKTVQMANQDTRYPEVCKARCGEQSRWH
ncbi:hypothetical protein ACLMJK_007794 [Lecanora helva]